MTLVAQSRKELERSARRQLTKEEIEWAYNWLHDQHKMDSGVRGRLIRCLAVAYAHAPSKSARSES